MLAAIRDIFPSTGVQGVYLVGGCVRDVLLQRRPLDYDIAVRGNPKAFGRRLADHLCGRLVVLGKPEMRVYRIIAARGVFDVAALTGEGIGEDLQRRDFTVNAMAFDLDKGRLVDSLGGKSDLARGLVRMVSTEIFRDDPVRLIRAFRLAAELGFAIDVGTMQFIEKNAARIKSAAGERIWAELEKIFSVPHSHPTIARMVHCNLLPAVIPELTALFNLGQGGFHRSGILDHTLAAYGALETILDPTGSFFQDGAPEELPADMLKFSMLLHDIGKPATRTVDAGGKVHFYGHAGKGARMARRICRRLKLSNLKTDYTVFIVGHHLRPLYLFEAWKRNACTRRALARFFLQCGGRTPDLLLHWVADTMGKGPVNSARLERAIQFYRETTALYYIDHRTRKAQPPLLNGYDLMEDFGLPPSPLFRTILSRLEENRLAGLVSTRQEAQKWVRNFLDRQKGPIPRE